MKLHTLTTIVLGSLVLTACGGWKATDVDNVVNQLNKTGGAAGDEAAPATGLILADTGSALIEFSGALEGKFQMDNQRGDNIACAYVEEGIKIRAVSKNFEALEATDGLNLTLPKDLQMPANLVVGNKAPITKLTFSMERDSGIWTPNRELDKCIVTAKLAQEDKLNVKIDCPQMDDIQNEPTTKLNLSAIIKCSLVKELK